MTFDPAANAATADDIQPEMTATESPPQEPPAEEETTKKERAKATKKRIKKKPPCLHNAAGTATITVPVDTCLPGYASRNIDFNATRRQAAAAKFLWSSLSAAGARYDGGRSSHPEGTPVDKVTDGIRWLLDRLADEIEDSTGLSLTDDFDLIFD